MVAPRKAKKVFCRVVRVPVVDDTSMNRMSIRPSDLLPWADPYISRLVTKLQSEVRRERQQQEHSRLTNRLNAHRQDLESHRQETVELDPPTPYNQPTTDWEWEGADEPRWTYRDQPTTDFME